jgi:hypothetical protein
VGKRVESLFTASTITENWCCWLCASKKTSFIAREVKSSKKCLKCRRKSFQALFASVSSVNYELLWQIKLVTQKVFYTPEKLTFLLPLYAIFIFTRCVSQVDFIFTPLKCFNLLFKTKPLETVFNPETVMNCNFFLFGASL